MTVSATDSGVAMVLPDLGGGGAQKVVSVLSEYWVSQDKRITIILTADTGERFFDLDPLVRIVVAGSRKVSRNLVVGGWRNLRTLIRLRKHLLRLRPGVVVSFLTPANILTVLACAGRDVVTVVSERNDISVQPLKEPWAGLRRLVYRRADVVTGNSRSTVDELKNALPGMLVVYIPNPVVMPCARTRREQATRDEQRLFLDVGRLHHQKGVDVLLRAFRIFCLQCSNWRLRIVGEGELGKQLRSLCRDLDIEQHVDWVGQEDTARHFREATVFVLASRYEGMPNVLLEAMSYGLAVIATRASSGVLELIEHRKTGLLVDVDDEQMLANSMIELARDPGLREKLGRAGESRAGDYKVTSIAKEWERCFEKDVSCAG